jgi:hypothetical protein
MYILKIIELITIYIASVLSTRSLMGGTRSYKFTLHVLYDVK